MADNKLVAIIESLSGVEKRECSNFLKSPYFNQRADVLRLWEFMLSPKNKNASPEEAFEFVYPKETHDSNPITHNSQWRYVQSFLLAQIENFLAQRASEQTPLLLDLHLAPVYRQKNLTLALNHALRRAAERLEKMPRDHRYFHFQYLLEWERFSASSQSQARMGENNLAAVSRALDTYIICSKLRLACLLESHRAVYKVDYDQTFLPGVLAFLETSDLKNVPAVALYFYCHRALTLGQEADFQLFKREMSSLPANFPPDERQIFLLLAINFCIRKLNSGESQFVREAFDFYKIGLETGALLEGGRLGRFGFKNIVALGLNLDEHDWVGEFIEKYAPFLDEKHRDANRDYNLARLHFSKKNYREAMPLLARVDESDLLLNLDSRVMLLKMYFEMEEWDALDALLASFKIQLLRKKKVVGYHHAHYLNTVRFVQKLSRLNFRDGRAVEKLRVEVLNCMALIEREWILGRLRAG